MMKDPQNSDESQALAHGGNQKPKQETSPSGQDRQEQYQRTREQAPTDQDGRLGSSSASPDPDNNLGRGTPGDREDRIRQRAHEIWEGEGRPEGQASDHWERASQDLDREDAEIQREGVAGEKPGVKPGPESDRKKPADRA